DLYLCSKFIKRLTTQSVRPPKCWPGDDKIQTEMVWTRRQLHLLFGNDTFANILQHDLRSGLSGRDNIYLCGQLRLFFSDVLLLDVQIANTRGIPGLENNGSPDSAGYK